MAMAAEPAQVASDSTSRVNPRAVARIAEISTKTPTPTSNAVSICLSPGSSCRPGCVGFVYPLCGGMPRASAGVGMQSPKKLLTAPPWRSRGEAAGQRAEWHVLLNSMHTLRYTVGRPRRRHEQQEQPARLCHERGERLSALPRKGREKGPDQGRGR